MGKSKEQKEREKQEAVRVRLSQKLRETDQTPFPTQLETPED